MGRNFSEGERSSVDHDTADAFIADVREGYGDPLNPTAEQIAAGRAILDGMPDLFRDEAGVAQRMRAAYRSEGEQVPEFYN